MDTKQKIIDNMCYYLASEDMGVYPQAWTDEKGVTTKRTEWQDGWNAHGTKYLHKVIKIDKWFKSLPQDKKSDIEDLIIADKLRIHVDGDEISTWILCNDLFYWACADGEDISFDEIPDLLAALKESSDNGDILWACRKRGMRPQKPYYKYFNEDEKKLFDACGPERTDD